MSAPAYNGKSKVIDLRSASPKTRWWQEPEATLRKDIYDALVALREHVENSDSKPRIYLSTLSTYKQRELTEVQTAKVGEWLFGYKVAPIDINQGFYRRTVFIKLLGGLLKEINKHERSQVIDGVCTAAVDEGSAVDLESISESCFAIHQNFAIMFLKEGNPNLVTPSKELILSAFSVPTIGSGESNGGDK